MTSPNVDNPNFILNLILYTLPCLYFTQIYFCLALVECNYLSGLWDLKYTDFSPSLES
jgi:hypothetical protein